MDDEEKKVVGRLLKAAATNADVREAGREIGKATLVVAKFIKNAVLPLAAVNFAVDKARDYFNGGAFENDLAEKLVNIPADEIIAPKASIAGPALQGLAYSFEEAELREMYLRLIASAMDARDPQKAHPAFVDIIRQLSAYEARLLGLVLPDPIGITAIEIRQYALPRRSWIMLLRHLIPLKDVDTGLPVEEPTLPAIVDNWIRLGLVTANYTNSLSVSGQTRDLYEWVSDRPEYKRLQQLLIDPTKHEIGFERGFIVRTAFGERFMHAVGIQRPSGRDAKILDPNGANM